MEGVFFCEFHTRYGRTLAFQYPSHTISSDEFDAISDYLIPKQTLCDQIIVHRSAARIVLCWPMCLEDERYDRNALIFSLGFVIRPSVDAKPLSGALEDVCERYGPVLRKACAHLAALEREAGMLSDASRKGELAHLLPQILEGLRDHGRCAVAADAANTIHLELPPGRRRGQCPAVEDHVCPRASRRAHRG